MKYIKAFEKVLFFIEKKICLVTGIMITSLIIINAFMRYVLLRNFGGSEELTLFFAFWFYFIGSSLASRDDGHITADMTSLFIKNKKILRILSVVKYLLSLLLSFIATFWVFNFIMWTLSLNPRSIVYRLPLVIPQMAIFISFILMDVYLLSYLFKSVFFLKEEF